MKLKYLMTKSYFPCEMITSPFPQIITGDHYFCICIKSELTSLATLLQNQQYSLIKVSLSTLKHCK